MSKSREWWINQWEALAGADVAWRYEPNAKLAYEDHQVYVKEYTRQQIETIHVIEYSAYEKLQKQNEIMREALQKISRGPFHIMIGGLLEGDYPRGNRRVDINKAEDVAREALAKIEKEEV